MKKSSLLLCSLCFSAGLSAQTDVPLLRFARFSDIHNQQSMIKPTGGSSVWLRQSFLTSLEQIRQKEDVDLLLLGGDYTSDVTTSKANWLRVRELIHEATQAAFPADARRRPVIYVTGNHDYEVANFDKLPKPYNAADFYTFPMSETVGKLGEDDCFYETADNGSGSPMKLLAAFHYVINGFDFVVLNCGRYFFESAWDYRYSDESVDWVDKKLDEICADDPNKTVFFIAHLPLPESRGVTPGKSVSASAASTHALTQALAKHPGVIYLYGHDHSSSSNKSYIEHALYQRITHYDSRGVTYIPADEQDPEPASFATCIQSVADSSWLGFNDYNLAPVDHPNRFVATTSTFVEGTVHFFGDNANPEASGYLHCGSSGRFSGNDTRSKNSSILLYEVDTTRTPYVGQRVDWPETDKTYALVSLSSAGGYYALTNRPYQSGSTSQRMVGEAAGNDSTLTFASRDVLWNFVDAAVAGDDEMDKTYCISDRNGYYLGYGDNLSLISKNVSDNNLFRFHASTVTAKPWGNSGALYAEHLSSEQYIHCGTNGLFSCNPTIGSGNTGTSIWIYHVEDGKAGKADRIVSGDDYLIVGCKNGKFYQMLNSGNDESGNDYRMMSEWLADLDTPADTFAFNGNEDALWRITDAADATAGLDTVEASPSFISAFMGSMRYNSLETNSSPGVNDSPIIQSLIVSVYRDSIVLSMKNYGETGTLSGKAVTAQIDDPIPDYVIRRAVSNSDVTYRYTVAKTDGGNRTEGDGSGTYSIYQTVQTVARPAEGKQTEGWNLVLEAGGKEVFSGTLDEFYELTGLQPSVHSADTLQLYPAEWKEFLALKGVSTVDVKVAPIFTDIEVGISSATQDQRPADVYTLTGRKLNNDRPNRKLPKGIYIVDGEKRIVP